MLEKLSTESILKNDRLSSLSGQNNIYPASPLNDSPSASILNRSSASANWVQSIGGNAFDTGYDVAVDNSGNLYTIGEFRGSVDLDGDGTPETSAGSNDVFIIKQNASNGNVAWAKKIGGSSDDIGYGIAVDGSGNVYTTGYFQGLVDINGDSTPEASKGFSDAFILKHDGTNGNVIWSMQIGGTGFDTGTAITVDGNGNVYTTGVFNGTVDINGDSNLELISRGGGDVFVIKQNASDGSIDWTRSLGAANSEDYGYEIAVDNGGNVYVTGKFQGSLDINGDGQGDLNSAGNTDGFLVKYNANGSIAWEKNIGGTGFDYSYGVAVDNNGHIYATGAFAGAVDFNGDGIPESNGANNDNIFVAKYNANNGSTVWTKSIAGNGSEVGAAIAVDNSGDIYTTGYFTNDVDLNADGTPETNAGGRDIFIIKQNGDNGRVISTQTIGSTGDDGGVRIAVDGNKNAYLTGYFQGTVNFSDRISRTAAGGVDGFVAKVLTSTNLGDTRHDFDGDGVAEILWRNRSSGDNVIWEVDGFRLISSNFVSPQISDQNWKIITTGDFNGDSKADIVWRNTATGENAIWMMNGLSPLSNDSQKLISAVDPSWTMVTAADFNGDGKDDILWRNQNTGENEIWFMDGFTINAQDLSIPVINEGGWEMEVAGDIDGDGKADIVWRNQLDGRNAVWLMDGAQVKEAKFIQTITDNNWQIKALGDVNGDGKQDVIWQNSASGESAVWFIDTTQLTNNNQNFNMVGELITDGNSQPLVVPFGWEIETAANYNGDRTADILWRNPLTGETAIWWMDGSSAIRTGLINDKGSTISADANWEITL